MPPAAVTAPPPLRPYLLQLPQLGRTRGASSNSGINQSEEQEGTAWLGCASRRRAADPLFPFTH